MDHLTKLFSENFFCRIQRWCHANGVRFIGHIVEDNRAHMNESVEETFEDLVDFPASGVAERWTPMDGKIEELPLYDRTEERVRAPIRLAPYESCFIVIEPDAAEGRSRLTTRDVPPEEWHLVGRLDDVSFRTESRGRELSALDWRAKAVRSSLPE